MGLFSNLLGTVLGGGGKPSVPPAPILGDSQQVAIEANLEALPDIQELASRTNLFNQQEIEKMLESAIPNYQSLKADIGSNISSLLRGEIPGDVQSAVERSAAGRSLSGGYAGTGMSRALTARDLGLTSLELTGQGLTSAERWIRLMASVEQPGMFNLASMFISPSMQYAADENAWGVQWLKNQIKALPDPLMQAIGQTTGGVIDIAGASVASYYLGGQTGEYIMQGNSEYSGANAPEYAWLKLGGGGGGGGSPYGGPSGGSTGGSSMGGGAGGAMGGILGGMLGGMMGGGGGGMGMGGF